MATVNFFTKVTVDETDISSYLLEYEVIDNIKDMTMSTVLLKEQVVSFIDITKDQEIIITRGNVTSTDTTIFKGNISKVSKNRGVNISVESLDKLWILKKITVTTSYDRVIDTQAGVISAIAKDLIETHGGLTANVEASGSLNVIDKFILRGDDILTKLQELADIIDYWLYYDPDNDEVVFKTKGFSTFGTTLETGINITAIPDWNFDYTKIVNDVTLIGDLQELETTQDETGDGATTQYTLSFKPESVKVFVNSVLKVGGITGQTTPFDYSMDKENKQINFEVAPTNTHPIEVRYSYFTPVKVRKKNPTSIAAYGTYQITKRLDTLQTTADAELKVNEITEKFSEPIFNTNINVYGVFGMQAGMKVTINDTINDENRDVFIRRIRYKYPDIIDEIEVDNEPLYEDYILQNEVIRRIENLERKNTSDTDLITQLISFNRDIKPRRRYFKLLKDVVNFSTSFVLAHPDGGVLGTDKLGENYVTQDVVTKLIQGQMTYEEYAYDTDFHDAVNSTATFSTVTNDISFTAGQIWYSDIIDLGTTLTQCRLSVGTVVGTLKYEISSDNKSSWQEISIDTLENVSSSDGLGTYIRITENAAGVATLDLTQDSFGQNTEPLIKLELIE